jgi:hypothetical protein
LIYTRFPFQQARYNYLERLDDEAWNPLENKDEQRAEKEVILQQEDSLWMAKDNSDKIYSRSNAFLLVGAFIAIAGVVFFTIQFSFTSRSINMSLPYLFELNLQRFGSLIFIEGIAFFFLRQYSNSMEDFRYYEAIKRQRENHYMVGLLFKEETNEFAKQFVETCDFVANPNKPSKDETTQLLEAKKVIGADPDVLQKFINLVKLTKK